MAFYAIYLSTNAASARASPSARHDTRIGIVVLTPRRVPLFFSPSLREQPLPDRLGVPFDARGEE